MPPFFMAFKVDGVLVTGEVAGWSSDQTLNPWDDQPQYVLNDDLTEGAPPTVAEPTAATTK